jgi:hypothetical protein
MLQPTMLQEALDDTFAYGAPWWLCGHPRLLLLSG